jgi:cysteine desulfurase
VRRIYLDHNATTPLAKEALASMLEILQEDFGNPSSIHGEGRKAREHLDVARLEISKLLGTRPGEITFTSGGTEANNFSLLGVALSPKARGGRIISTQVEHASIINPLKQLENDYEIVLLPVDKNGYVDPAEVERAINDQTLLVSVQWANSETGVLQNIHEIGTLARKAGVLFHSDMVQVAGKMEINLESLPVDLASFSAHKLYGPKGVGALYIRRGTQPLFSPLCGGGQEKKRRGGTENVAGIVGFGKACELAKNWLESDKALDSKDLGEFFLSQVRAEIPNVQLFGEGANKLCNTFNLGFSGVESDTLLIGLDIAGIAVSAGSACSSGSGLPSPTLLAMGVPEEEVNSSLRFTLGRNSNKEDLTYVVECLSNLVRLNRKKH